MNRVFREEKKFLLSQAEALAVGHRLEQIMLPDPTTARRATGSGRCISTALTTGIFGKRPRE